jgi:hypothetical protein
MQIEGNISKFPGFIGPSPIAKDIKNPLILKGGVRNNNAIGIASTLALEIVNLNL